MDLTAAPLEVRDVDLLLNVRPAVLAAVICKIVVPCGMAWLLVAIARARADRRIQEDELERAELNSF